MERIDLHTHSTFSDGSMTPAELVRHAKKAGLCAMALSDHDTISGVDEAVEVGTRDATEEDYKAALSLPALTTPTPTPSCLTARQRGFTGNMSPTPRRS